MSPRRRFQESVISLHELPITQSICNIAVNEAKRLGAKRVYKITIQMGDYCDYVPEIIQTYFDLVSEGTLAENAQIQVERVPATLYCRDCRVESRVEHFRMRCPLCGGREVALRTGREFYISSMEVEDGD